MAAIELKKLAKSYKDVEAVTGIDLAIEEGELFSLLGMNGAGKSTTIKMLSCVCRPTSGDALIMGKSIITEPQEVKRLINVSPQETAVAANLTVRENLMLMAKLYGCEHPAHAVDEMISDFSLGEVASKQAKKLSGGWQRRLSIAMALITRPKALFLDEPTLGLDVVARRELWSHIRRLKGKVTIILTTHYLEEAEALSDRIAIMRSGRITALGTAGQIVAASGRDNFEDAFIALSTEEQA